MASLVLMPKVGITVESCVITKWHKQKGDSVKAGDILFSYETDKASIDEEAKEDGVLLDIFHVEGDDVPCLEGVAVIGKEGEDYSDLIPKAKNAEEAIHRQNQKKQSLRRLRMPLQQLPLKNQTITKLPPAQRAMQKNTALILDS